MEIEDLIKLPKYRSCSAIFYIQNYLHWSQFTSPKE